MALYLPGESVTLRSGEFFLAPRAVPHAYEVGPDGARALVSSVFEVKRWMIYSS